MTIEWADSAVDRIRREHCSSTGIPRLIALITVRLTMA